MRFSTPQHKADCGMDLPARSLSMCLLSQDGEIVRHRQRKTSPEMCLKAMAPDRAELVVCVAGLCTWSGLADLCARAGMPWVLGHARSLPAIHGGKAKNDPIDAQTIAGLLRGGLLPQASVSPAAMRATRDLLRRRTHGMRQRAELFAPVQHTNRQYPLPEIGKKRAYTANRAGVAERFEEVAGHKTIEGDRALITYDAQLLNALALFSLQTAKPHDAQPLYL